MFSIFQLHRRGIEGFPITHCLAKKLKGNGFVSEITLPRRLPGKEGVTSLAPMVGCIDFYVNRKRRDAG
jgi:hypothetical protein